MENYLDEAFISDVIKRSLEVAPEDIPEEFSQVAFELPRWHLIMLQDRARLDYYSEIIRTKVQGKVVLDLGTGSGVLSHLALKWGAKKVYSVEHNPALQAAYRHLMKDHLKSGRAELICDDAKLLRRDHFAEAPTVIVHELFGYLGVGENIVPILRALTEEGILRPETALIPDAFEVWTRPALSDVLTSISEIKDFEGYPLSKLNIFGSQEIWQEEYQSARDSKWEPMKKPQLLFKCDLKELSIQEKIVASYEATDASHVKVWLNLVDQGANLEFSNDHLESESHWANGCLTIPFWLRGNPFKVEYLILPDRVEFSRFL